MKFSILVNLTKDSRSKWCRFVRYNVHENAENAKTETGVVAEVVAVVEACRAIQNLLTKPMLLTVMKLGAKI